VLATLTGRAALLHFEVSQPSLHDIFVRIARPEVEGNGDA
jgi:hypothetical protein